MSDLPPSDTIHRSQARVLVVDDELLMRESLACILGIDHIVDTAGSVVEALGRLREGARYDMILSDVTMPGGTGVDLHDSIAREFPWCAPRVVFMTGGASDPVRERIDRLPNLCLDKPLDFDRLRSIVGRSAGRDPGSERSTHVSPSPCVADR